MKVIPKLAFGGGFERIFVTHQHVPNVEKAAPQRAAATESRRSGKGDGDSTKGKLTEKDLFAMLKDVDGLPNEMLALLSKMMNVFALSLGEDLDPMALQNAYLSSIYEMRIAALNKAADDKAWENVTKRGAEHNLAISGYNVFVLDNKGKISTVRYEEYAKNPSKYTPMTNASLHYARANYKSLINDLLVFNVLNNSVSDSSINEKIKSLVYNLGSSTIKLDLSYDTASPEMGLKVLQQLAKSDETRDKLIAIVAQNNIVGTRKGVYKLTSTSTSQRSLVNAAINYITSLLTPEEKVFIALKYGSSDYNAISKDFVTNRLIGTLTESESVTSSFYTDKTMNGEADSSTVGGIKLNAPSKWLSGYGTKNNFVIRAGTKSSVVVNANVMGLTDAADKAVGPNATLLKVASGTFGPILDLQNATMGGVRIDPSQFGNVVISDGKIASVDFPCLVLLDGTIVPRLDRKTIEAKEAADRQIKSKNIDLNSPDSIAANYLTINNIYKNNGLPAAYDSAGRPLPGTWCRFAVMNAKAGARALNTTSNSLLLEDNNDANKKSYIKTTGITDWNDGWFGKDHLYIGTLWVPVSNNLHTALQGTPMKPGLALDLEERILASEKRNHWNTGRQPSKSS